ncbi:MULTISPECIES: winged helix DNA-binding domain-containing protein [unclassified Streptomyces]|uniref:winged helix DNA-binding domain-containing protein n=1 Tax=unclassified Streptomyces TaxID=2593676 RepID=UPI001E333102|nr:winged helix DNA-binding domain-containing protein [Streptomyces sp. CB02980]MCB8902673.1 winged helix DNA-binding domain-containing protein [Streptomyces sp. CB02980]
MGETRTRTIDAAERRARLGVRHRLAGSVRAGSAEEVAGALVALHGTDPASVFLAVGARLAGKAGPVAEVERALYEDRSLVRMHGMRHTVFVFPAALAPAVQTSTSDPAAVRERTTLIQHLAAGSDFDAAWLAETERLVLAELAVRGEATGAELGRAVPALRSTYLYAKGTRQGGVQSVASRVLRVLGMEGRIVRGRPQGTWTSSQFRWARPADARSGPASALDPATARAELIQRWLRACGPATEADLKWWTGWKVTDVRGALAAVGALPVTLDEGTGFVLPDDLDPVTERVAEPEPWAALLPALDPTAMGWQARDWYLDPEHRAALYDRSENIGPTVWWDGRIVGGWAQRPDGEIIHRLLTDVGAAAGRAIGAEAERLAGWVGDVRVTPRFRTPLERELGA